LLDQRVARLRDAMVMFVAAASVGMRGLSQPPEGGIDLRRLERAHIGHSATLTLFSKADITSARAFDHHGWISDDPLCDGETKKRTFGVYPALAVSRPSVLEICARPVVYGGI
jgi:hypothetical protein